MIAHFYNLRSDHLDKSRAHLTPYVVILLLFPMLYYSCDYFFTIVLVIF